MGVGELMCVCVCVYGTVVGARFRKEGICLLVDSVGQLVRDVRGSDIMDCFLIRGFRVL